MFLGYSFEIGRATARQYQREQINAEYKANNRLDRNSGRQTEGVRADNPPSQPNAETPSQQAVEVAFLRVPIGEGMLVIVTLLLVGVTYQLVSNGKVSAERQLRAYISLEWSRIVSGDGGNTFTVEVQIKNAGQTPALRVRHRMAAEVWVQHTAALSFATPEIDPSEIPIGPGISFTLRQPIAVGGASGTGSIDVGQRLLFVWGSVEYFDIFDEPRTLEFRSRSGDPIRAHDGTVMRTVGWALDSEAEGNRTT
jgi:hypothetical protein